MNKKIQINKKAKDNSVSNSKSFEKSKTVHKPSFLILPEGSSIQMKPKNSYRALFTERQQYIEVPLSLSQQRSSSYSLLYQNSGANIKTEKSDMHMTTEPNKVTIKLKNKDRDKGGKDRGKGINDNKNKNMNKSKANVIKSKAKLNQKKIGDEAKQNTLILGNTMMNIMSKDVIKAFNKDKDIKQLEAKLNKSLPELSIRVDFYNKYDIYPNEIRDSLMLSLIQRRRCSTINDMETECNSYKDTITLQRQQRSIVKGGVKGKGKGNKTIIENKSTMEEEDYLKAIDNCKENKVNKVCYIESAIKEVEEENDSSVLNMSKALLKLTPAKSIHQSNQKQINESYTSYQIQSEHCFNINQSHNNINPNTNTNSNPIHHCCHCVLSTDTNQIPTQANPIEDNNKHNEAINMIPEPKPKLNPEPNLSTTPSILTQIPIDEANDQIDDFISKLQKRNQQNTKEIIQIYKRKEKEINILKEQKRKIFIEKNNNITAISPKHSLIIPLSQRLNTVQSTTSTMSNLKYIQANKSQKCFSILSLYGLNDNNSNTNEDNTQCQSIKTNSSIVKLIDNDNANCIGMSHRNNNNNSKQKPIPLSSAMSLKRMISPSTTQKCKTIHLRKLKEDHYQSNESSSYKFNNNKKPLAFLENLTLTSRIAISPPSKIQLTTNFVMPANTLDDVIKTKRDYCYFPFNKNTSNRKLV